MIFFASFCCFWDFLLEVSKLKKISDYVLWNVWTNIKTLYAQNSNFVFFGTAIGLFSQSFFYRPMVADIFTLHPPSPTHPPWKSFLWPSNVTCGRGVSWSDMNISLTFSITWSLLLSSWKELFSIDEDTLWNVSFRVFHEMRISR